MSSTLLSKIPDAKQKPVKAGSKLKALPKVTPGIKKAVNQYIEATNQMKEWKAKADFQGEILVDHAKDVQDTESFEGRHEKSYLIPGEDVAGESVFVTYSRIDKFSPIDDNDVVTAIRKAITPGMFNRLFEKEISLSINPNVFKDKAKVAELASLLQAAFGDKLGEFFVKSEQFVAKEGLDAAQYNIGVTPKEKRQNYEALQSLVKQNKPTLKI